MATLTTEQLITSLYVAAFARAPDKSGLSYWKGQMDSGVKLDDVISSFLSSPEAALMVGPGASNQVFLNNLYTNVLNRTADASGGQYWQGRLDSLDNRAALVKEFIGSISDGTGNDTKLLQNKIEIGQKFAASASGDNTTYAKAMLTYVTSETDALATAQALNTIFDNPQPAVPAQGNKTTFDGSDVEVLFKPFVNVNPIVTKISVGAGVELPNLSPGFVIDVDGSTIKLGFVGAGTSTFTTNSLLSFADTDNMFAAFTGVNVTSNSLKVGTGANSQPFDPSRVSVTDDVVKINISGVAIDPSTSLEFTVLF